MYISYVIKKLDNGYTVETFQSVFEHRTDTKTFYSTLVDALGHIAGAVNFLKVEAAEKDAA
jgi:hypothetical protein